MSMAVRGDAVTMAQAVRTSLPESIASTLLYVSVHGYSQKANQLGILVLVVPVRYHPGRSR